MSLLKCLLFVSFCFTVTGAHSIQRRSLDRFRQMIEDVTNRDAFAFNSYGKWCGLAGSGVPMDSIDRCCMHHHMCYKYINKRQCKIWDNIGPYFAKYHWQLEHNDVTCTDNPGCLRASCNCDRNAAICFRDHISAYNPQHRKFFGYIIKYIIG